MTPKASKLDPATLTAEELRAALDYDPHTGVFTWLPRSRDQFQFDHSFEKFNAERAGQRAGRQHARGTVIGLKLVQFPAEQLAWLHAHGEWPAFDIEFADGDPNNCTIMNLHEGDLPFEAGMYGPAYKRRGSVPRKSRKTAQRAAEKPVEAAEPSVVDSDALVRVSERLAALGVEQKDRRRLMREAGDLL